MIFSELYGAYYNAVARIITQAAEKPLTKEQLRAVAMECAFGESAVNIESAITKQDWQLVTKAGTTPIKNPPSMPLTNLQKRWLKAVMLDPRVKLFGYQPEGLEDVQPLFTPQDICVFDRYGDGDPYEDEKYISNFHLILDAIGKKYPLRILMRNKSGRNIYVVVMPQYLEYSQKDDKFRLIAGGRKYADVINLARIISCKRYTGEYTPHHRTRQQGGAKKVVFELRDDRNALERALLHFAHFEKQAEKVDEDRYIITVTYDADDETELLIRILSFGPMIKVTSPDSFVKLIKQRLTSQKDCGC